MKRKIYTEGKSQRILTAVAAATAILPVLVVFSYAGSDTHDSLKSSPIKTETKKILFVGDTTFGENYPQTPRILEQKGYDYPIKKLAPLLRASDLIIANLETPITDRKECPFKESKAYCHWTDVEKAPYYFKKYNLHTFALANNHILDFGIPGLEQTLKIMETKGIAGFGAGITEKKAARPFTKIFSVGKKELRLAVIATFEYRKRYESEYHFYANSEQGGVYRLSTEKIAQQIKTLKASDPETFVIIFPHWGKNYRWKTDRQTSDARQFIYDGADLVIGHGAHTVQEIEVYKDHWIIYGLGNFVFLSPGRYTKQKALPYSCVAQLILEDQRHKIQKSIRLYPIFSDNRVSNYQPRPLTGTEFEQFMATLFQKSPLDTRQQRLVRSGEDDIGFFVELLL